jgi:hypothetical protein
MFRKAISSFVLMAFLSMLFYSCSADRSMDPEATSSSSGESNLEETLNADVDVHELVDIEVRLVERALFTEVNSSQLRYALETGDAEYIAALFGYSITELEEINDQVLGLCETIYERYPQLGELVEELKTNSCPSCDVEVFLEKWDTILANYSSGSAKSSCMEPAICHIEPLVVGLIMCAYTLGATMVGYLACAYIIVCSFCEGGWASLIC